jgi:hypothetical protein
MVAKRLSSPGKGQCPDATDTETTPVKKKTRGKAKTNAGPAASSASPQAASQSPAVLVEPSDTSAKTINLNSELLVDVLKAINTIRDHEEFQDIFTTTGVQNGRSAPFSDAMFKTNMESDNPIYESSNSFFVLDAMNFVTKAIPAMKSRITWLMEHHFGRGIPTRFPFSLVGVVTSGLNVKENHGKIALMSPPEMMWAAIFWLQDFTLTSPSPEDCAQVRQLFLDVVVSFEKIDSKDDRVWRAYQLRENLVNDGESVKLSPIQRLCAVMDSKAVVEKKLGMKPNTLGSKAMVKEWERVAIARNSEQVLVILL